MTSEAKEKLMRDLAEASQAIFGEGAKSPSRNAFAEAEALLALLPDDIPLGSAWASGDGEVGFTWSRRHGANGFLELALTGRGEIEWSAELSIGSGGGFIPFSTSASPHLPAMISFLLRHLLGERK